MRRHRRLFPLLTSLSAFVLASCNSKDDFDFFQDVDPEPIEATVSTAVPVAYAATATSATVNGATLPNVEVVVPCAGFPCAILLRVEIDEQSLPFRLGVRGDILVAGYWTSATQGILSLSFMDTAAGSSRFPVSNFTTIPVSVQGDEVRVVYANIDVDLSIGPIDSVELTDAEVQLELARLQASPPNDTTVALGMDAWIITTDTRGTADDLSDDEYSIGGASQLVEASSSSSSSAVAVFQLALVDTRISNECPLNPTTGSSILQDVAASSGPLFELPVVAVATIDFHPECDGRADVGIATGNYATSTGSSIALGFDSP